MGSLAYHAMSQVFLLAELITLYIGIPTALVLPLPGALRGAAMLLAISYVGVVSYRHKIVRTRNFRFNGFSGWTRVLGLFAGFMVVSTIAVRYSASDALFSVVRNEPILWMTMVVVYCLFSVLPQVIVFRAYFFTRYEPLIGSGRFAVVVSAIVFSFAHVIIAHPIVFALTFAGGFLFSTTYLQSKSITVTSIEHALYGLWLFTVGLGGLFAFPV